MAELINPVPYEVELVREDNRVIEITIRATPGEELTPMQLRSAMQAVLRHVERRPRQTRTGTDREHRPLTDQQATTIEELELPAPEMRQLLHAHESAGGRITDLYLARLALAYELAARNHRDVSRRIATALNRPPQTVKGHLMRARKEGYLSPTVEGREGGAATDKAKEAVR